MVVSPSCLFSVAYFFISLCFLVQPCIRYCKLFRNFFPCMASLIDVTCLYGIAMPVAALQRRVVANLDYYEF